MNLWKHLIFVLLCVFSAVSQAAWSVRYQHTDVLGSVIAESNAQGTITQRFGYKPFGEGSPTQKTGVGYTGHLEDTDLGLTYMKARYYDPVIGRFYSNDPIGFRDTQSYNRYSYANNNPYKYVDPTGMASQQTDSFCGVSGCDYSYKSGDSSKSNKGESDAGGYSPVAGQYFNDNGELVSVDVTGDGRLVSSDGSTAYQFDYTTGLLVNPLATGATASVCPECYLIGGGRLIVASGYKLIAFVTGRAAPTYTNFARGVNARNAWKVVTLGRLLRSGSKPPSFYWAKAEGNFTQAVTSLGKSNAVWNQRLIPFLPIGIAGNVLNEQ